MLASFSMAQSCHNVCPNSDKALLRPVRYDLLALKRYTIMFRCQPFCHWCLRSQMLRCPDSPCFSQGYYRHVVRYLPVLLIDCWISTNTTSSICALCHTVGLLFTGWHHMFKDGHSINKFCQPPLPQAMCASRWVRNKSVKRNSKFANATFTTANVLSAPRVILCARCAGEPRNTVPQASTFA